MTQILGDTNPDLSPLNPARRLDDVGVALGSGLVAAAVVMSAFYSRGGSDLDLSNF